MTGSREIMIALTQMQLNRAGTLTLRSQIDPSQNQARIDVNLKNWTDPSASIIMKVMDRLGGHHVKQKLSIFQIFAAITAFDVDYLVYP